MFTEINKSDLEYKIPDNIIGIIDLKNKLYENNIDVLVYQSYNITEIEMLNKLNKVKTIFYNHCSFLVWIYCNRLSSIKSLYNAYKESKYIISLIHFENDFLFKKWGINSILMNNFIIFYLDKVNSNFLYILFLI